MNSSKIKIVFFGTPEFAVASLSALLKQGFDVRAVVTMPDKVGGRGNKIIESAVKKYAVAKGLSLLQPVKLSDPEFVSQLQAIGADLFIVIAFRMLPRVVWTMPPMGTFNLHASLLPLYRGAAPINRAIINGETHTGVTTFLLKHEIDTGDILRQEVVEIGPDENVESLYGRLMELGAGVTVDTVRQLADGTAKPIPQDQLLGGGEPTPAPKIFHDDCRIDWLMTSESIHNLVRGLSPVPGAWCEVSFGGSNGEAQTTLKVLRTRRAGEPTQKLAPGELQMVGKCLVCGTASGALELMEVQPAGKKAMEARAWYNGLQPGKNDRILWLI